MKILWVEDFGGGLAPSKVILDTFSGLISEEILDAYEPDNEDVPGQLKVIFETNSIHRIDVYKSYLQWKEAFGKAGKDFDVAILDINLELYKTPPEKMPDGIESPNFDKKAGFHIYHQLIKSGFPDSNIAFFTGEEGSLREFSRYCGEVLIERPKFTFEKKASDFEQLRVWLTERANAEELILRRGVIEGCRFVRDEVSNIELGDLEDRLLFFKTTQVRVEYDPETYKTEVIDHLTKLENFFLSYRDHHKSYALFSFVRELAEKWDISSGYFNRDKESPGFRSKLEDRFYKTSQFQMKRLRNWSVHGLLSYELSEKDVAYLFILAMRSWARFDIGTCFEYERILSQLFHNLSPHEMSVKLVSDIERQLEQSYFDLRWRYTDLTHGFRETADSLTGDNYFLALSKALGEVPERIMGHESESVKRRVREVSMTLFYQSYWHGLFPLWKKSPHYPNLQTVGFSIEMIPTESFLFLLGRMLYRESFEHTDAIAPTERDVSVV